jgi:hypothetical protein
MWFNLCNDRELRVSNSVTDAALGKGSSANRSVDAKSSQIHLAIDSNRRGAHRCMGGCSVFASPGPERDLQSIVIPEKGYLPREIREAISTW